MEITEVRIKLMDDPHDRLQAFCSITFDNCFVIRDLKIIQGTRGSFVAMPSRKLTDRCPCCHTKNHLRADYCNQCGVQLDSERAARDDEGRARLYADIAHPINSGCRESIQECVLQNFEEELIRAKEPGYICRYDDFGEENYATISGEDRQEERTDSSRSPAAGAPATRTPAAGISADEPAPVEPTQEEPSEAGASRADSPSREAFTEEFVNGAVASQKHHQDQPQPPEQPVEEETGESPASIPFRLGAKQHRIDSAAASAVPPSQSSRSSRGERLRMAAEQEVHGSTEDEDDEDEFGAGLL
ncbi:MAG: SpoVG family protein [Planctomycetaceae bacterium]|nr:SpoVG family protein [Planctomycetaceae bacterium]